MLNYSIQMKRKQCTRLKEHDNLSVIPYIRGRLVFADLVARAIEEEGFEQVIVDLPFFMNRSNLWENAVKMFPHVSSLLFRKEDGSFAAFPFTPADAACIALSAVQTQKDWGRDIELQCIDDSRVIHYPRGSLSFPKVGPNDDYSVFINGLDVFCNEQYDQLEEAWAALGKEQRFFNEYRAGLVSDRLKSYLKNGKKTLFVCEYSLWWLVKKIVMNKYAVPRQYFSYPWKDVKGVIMIDDSLRLWKRGALDDYPAVVARFYDIMRTGLLSSFSKIRTIEDIINKSLTHDLYEKTCGGSSVRRSLTFHKYLRNTSLSSGKISSIMLSHLCDAANSCLGRKAAKRMIRRFFSYPEPAGKRIFKYVTIREGSSIVTLNNKVNDREAEIYLSSIIKVNSYSLEEVYDGYLMPDREMRIFNRFHHHPEREILKFLGYSKAITWSIKADYYQYELASKKVREMQAQQARKTRIKKSYGAISDGIHWKATINARSLGEDAVYIRYGSRSRGKRQRKFDAYTPVIFIFTDNFKGHWYRQIMSTNSVQRHKDLYPGEPLHNNCTASDTIYHALYSLNNIKKLKWGHIDKRDISSMALLYNRADMDNARYKAIAGRPNRFVCRMAPLSDPIVTRFQMTEAGIAWAVKYAEHTVFVVAKKGWTPSEQLSSFAKSRNIEIRDVSLSLFNPDIIERLRTMYFTSPQLKKHPKRDEIVEKFMD